MLQPSQLTDVARDYAAEIVELRIFLTKAGVPVGTAQAIANVASRVQHDRTFHRDLAATLWVTTEGGDRQIGFADLLGLVAIASAGVHLASDAEEQDALALLQFMKEIRRIPAPDAKSIPVLEVSKPATPHDAQIANDVSFEQVKRRSSADAGEIVSVEGARPALASPAASEGTSRNRSAWVIAGVGMLFALFLGGWLYHRSLVATPDGQQVAAPADRSIGPHVGTPAATVRSSGERDGRATSTGRPDSHQTANAGVHRTSTPEGTSDTAVYPPSRSVNSPDASANTASALNPTVGNESGASLPTASRPASSSTTTILVPRTVTRPASASPVPASTLSKRLGASTLPQYATDQSSQSIADAPKHPRLLRRHPLTNGDPGLVAELQPLDNPAMRAPSSSTGTTVGSVRPTALGIMAANVLYSPTPAYPSAASAAHVTGEVKLEAEIDRDGTVTYARVVSGPPLLRDAALSAVQQWRYRPYLSRGKAVPVTALAVMDFQLP